MKGEIREVIMQYSDELFELDLNSYVSINQQIKDIVSKTIIDMK